ncbi:hypothetical protein EKD04_017590 [Chloroflexales bacterium ZM16-3]|nr:hypothetical protein [Chloroflexales bacterium ZM16-3]
MNDATNDIQLASPSREIVVWRRIGGGNPGYGLDVDGKTQQFNPRGRAKLVAAAQELAKIRGVVLAKPAVTPIVITGSPGLTHVDPELDRMLGRFYVGDDEYGWDEQM